MKEETTWQKTYQQLKDVMEKEIVAMREVLANLHQEETSLILKDTSQIPPLLQQRTLLLETLSQLRENRKAYTEALENLALKEGKAPHLPLLDFLSKDSLNHCETLYLRDQILSLVDRVNLQHIRNEALLKALPSSSFLPPIPEKKEKIGLTTLEYPEEK